jgi:hypothetical protein
VVVLLSCCSNGYYLCLLLVLLQFPLIRQVSSLTTAPTATPTVASYATPSANPSTTPTAAPIAARSHCCGMQGHPTAASCKKEDEEVSTEGCPGDVTTSSRTQPLLLATGPTGSHGQFQVKRRHQKQQLGMTGSK